MTDDNNISTVAETADSRPPPPPSRKMASAWKALKKAPISAKFGLIVIFCYVFVALFAPFLTPYGESEIVGGEFELWSEKHPVGTDNLGRDMLTRLLYGARNTVGIAFITTCLAFLIGGVAGIMAAIFGGWTDRRRTDGDPATDFRAAAADHFRYLYPGTDRDYRGARLDAGVSIIARGQFKCGGARLH
jgi:peptide/nickel transport system permease protein